MVSHYKPSSGRCFYDDQYESDDEEGLNNTIVFSTDNFFGRKEEIQSLKELFDQLFCHDDGSDDQPSLCPVAIIQASSGTGKSALVQRFIDNIRKEVNDYTVCYMHGRFERTCTDPFSAILEALDDFFRLLLLQGKDRESNLVRIRAAIKDSLQAEISALTALIPSLGDVLRDDKEEKPTVLRGSTSNESVALTDNDSFACCPNSWNRIRYLFKVFFCAICTKDYPLVMFLDDCQWVDDASLGVVESLLQDPDIRYFMFIGNATQGLAEDDKTKFARVLRDIEVPSRKITRIDLMNLSIDEVGEFIADTLKLEVETTRPLTEIIYGKTRGNIFFSMQALEELHRRNILYFSVITFQWEWNLDGVEFENALSDNVSEYVSSKIESLPRKLKRALVIASYTKATFDVDTLQSLMNEDGIDINHKQLVGLLDVGVLAGLLLNTVGTGIYKFAHDRIQQASYWMVPCGKERDKLRIMVGRKLYELYFLQEGKDWMLFVAADHLNSCIGHGGKDDLSLAELNLACGKKARFLAAFVPASLYLRLAVNYLRKLSKDPWESHYELSYHIYREITDNELCVGNFESGNELARIVVNNARNLGDKLPTFLVLAEAKGRQQKHSESLLLCQEALIKVGAIPKRMHFLHMKKDVRVIKRFFKKYSDYDILLLPICQDKAKIIVMDLLSQASRRALFCGDQTEFLFCIARKLRMTFEYGFTRGSAHAFASYGQFLQTSDSDVEGALRMGRLARQILDKTDPISRPMKSQTLYVVAYFIEAWGFPREHVMESLREAHTSGMAKGNIEVGFQCIVLCNIFAQNTGYPLVYVEKAGAELMQQLHLFKVDSVLAQLNASRLSLLCLTGKKKIDWKELEPSDVSSGESNADVYRYVFGYLSRLELGVYFGNFEFAVRMSGLLQPYIETDGSYICVSREHFYSGIAYVGLTRETGVQKYHNKSIEYVKKLRHLCRTRGLNVHHKCLLMEAEVLSLECKDVQKIAAAYDEAIISAVKMGYNHDAAFGSELAGASMLLLSEDSGSMQYLNQACDLWREHGAHEKVRHISAKRSIMDGDTDSDISISFEHNIISSVDLSDSRASLDLDLLVGITMQTAIQIGLSGAESKELSDDDGLYGTSDGKLVTTKSAKEITTTVENTDTSGT